MRDTIKNLIIKNKQPKVHFNKKDYKKTKKIARNNKNNKNNT